jgi:hypothetical protein
MTNSSLALFEFDQATVTMFNIIFVDIVSVHHMITMNSDSILNIHIMKARNLVGPIIIVDNSNVTLSNLNFRGLKSIVTTQNRKSLFEFFKSGIKMDNVIIENLELYERSNGGQVPPFIKLDENSNCIINNLQTSKFNSQLIKVNGNGYLEIHNSSFSDSSNLDFYNQ